MSIDEFVSKEDIFAELLKYVNIVDTQEEKLCAQEATIKAQNEKIKAQEDTIKEQSLCIDDLNERLDKLWERILLSQKKIFGQSSEKTDYRQMSLFHMGAEETPELKKQSDEVVSRTRKPKSSFKDKYSNVKTGEVYLHTLEGAALKCPCCNGNMLPFDTVVKKLLRLVPAVAEIIEHWYLRYRCPECEAKGRTSPIVQAKDDDVRVYPNCIAEAGSIAHVITQKTELGLPWYRQEMYWKRVGVDLDRQTMSNWSITCSERYFEPIYRVLAELLVQLDIIHADETPYPVLHDGESKSKTGRMWLFTSGACAQNPIVIYVYDKSRGYAVAEQFLRDFVGYIHADGYQVYKKLPNAWVSECWAHLHRKFVESCVVLGDDASPDCDQMKALAYCNAIFRIDSRFAALDSHERKRRREAELRPLVTEFFEWLESLNNHSKHTFGTAINHALKQREYLLRFFEDGRLELSNNRAERQIKPLVIGRKNFLFSNTVRGAKATAVLYSLTETALALGLDPYKYFVWVLKKAPTLSKTDPDWAEQLVPHNAPKDCYVKLP